MTCPQCRAETRDGLRFCEDCGSRLTQTCSQCGGELAPGKRFCGSCGAPAAGQATTRTPSPESYTPKHLAEKILTSKAALEGERKQVTVLFADVKGSMELLADRDPEEARALLDPVLERMMESVHRYEGTVNQVMGDGIMALFGAPLAHEDHAIRACYAALEMQAAIRRYAEEARRSHGISLEIRVGLNSGEVVVRAIGSDLRMDYTAVGQTAHLAARMEQLATGGRSLLTAGTLRLAEGFIEVKPLGPVPVKGLAAPIEVYDLIGAGPVRSRLHAGAARGLTHFVGREGELDQLSQALGRANGGHGQVLAIVGEPGVGKSRLVWEATHSHRVHDWVVLQAGSVSYGKATALLPVIDLLKRYFAIEDRDGSRAVREKLTGKLLTLDRAQEGSLPALLSLLGVPIDDPQWSTLDPPQRRRRTLDAVRRLLLRESYVQPLLVIFEDLHWIDSETQTLLDGLVESLPAARVLLLVNYRPEYQHGWGSKTYYTQLRLGTLPPESVEELLHALLGDEVSLEPIKRLLVERTEGNPFFLEESVRTLVETQVLIGEQGSYRLAKGLTTIQVPPTVQAILAARIDRLPPDEKRLLQSAAVIGKDVPYAILQAIADQPEEVLRQNLAHLQAAELLYEARLYPDLEYTFKHALTHEVAYGSLVQERRRALHASIAEAIESRYPDRIAEQSERLAHHAYQGQVWAKAVVYLGQAGTRALGRSANREAAAQFERALDAITHLPESRETLERAVDLWLDLRSAVAPTAGSGMIVQMLRRAQVVAERLGDAGRLGRVWSYLSNSAYFAGQEEEARILALRARAAGEAHGDIALQVHANMNLGHVSYTRGDYRESERYLRENLQLLDGERARQRFGFAAFPAVTSLQWLCWSLAERGDFEAAVRHGEAASALAEEVDHYYSLVLACWGLGRVYEISGDTARAGVVLERGLALATEFDFGWLTAELSSVLGAIRAREGRVAEGITLVERALEGFGEFLVSGPFTVPMLVSWGEVQLRDGREAARDAAMRALTVARERGERGNEATALRLLGEIAGQPEALDAKAAGTYYDEALTLATELGMRPLAAHCHLGLGKLNRQTGDRAKADEHLTTAATMYREMGMNFWLEKADAELGGVER